MRELAAHVVRALGLRPRRRPAQDQLAAGVAQQVGQVRRAAGELPDLGQAVRDAGPRARAATRRTAVDVEGVLLADVDAVDPVIGRSRAPRCALSPFSLAACCAHRASYAARSLRLSAYAERAGSSGTISSSPRVDAGEHRGGDVVGGERRRRRPAACRSCAERRRRCRAASHQVGPEVRRADDRELHAVRRELVARGLGERHDRRPSPRCRSPSPAGAPARRARRC